MPASTDELTRERIANFDQLCVELGLQRFAYSLDLHDVLKRMAARQLVSAKQRAWLVTHEVYPVFAVLSEHDFVRTRSDGHLTAASRWGREAAQPDAAIARARRSIQSHDPVIQSFGYTTGAAAYLGRGDLSNAEDWIGKALQLNDARPHPHNVLRDYIDDKAISR